MTRCMTIAIFIALAARLAHAQTGESPEAAADAAVAAEPASAASASPAPSAKPEGAPAADDATVRDCVAVAKSNAKQMQNMCFEAMHHDPELLALCKNEWSQDYMEQDARKATRNKKHVVAAYAVLWVLVVVFLVGMWLRQRKLTVEIDRLERDLKKALEEEG